MADEYDFELGSACIIASQGVCALGVISCDVDQGWSCRSVFRPTAEICDGKDNDCNGSVDEQYPQK